MQNPNRLIALPIIGICVCIAFLFSSFNTQSQDVKHTPQNAEQVNTTKFPIADLHAPLPIDPSERARRQAKGKKYNNKHAPKLEQVDGVYVVNESLPTLSALPIENSSAVILGEIKDAKAYLSEDGTAVYSEFIVNIQSVLKDSGEGLSVGSLTEAQRYGGRLRLPSGKIVTASVDHQDMPRVGGKYVLFLTGNEAEGFSILSGYELRGGKVHPLDSIRPTHPMAQYKGRDESTLLNDLFSVLSNSPASSRLN
jgi:hypothetical protein